MKRHSFFGYFTFVDPDIYGSSTYQFYDCVITKSFGEIPKGTLADHAVWYATTNTLIVFAKDGSVLFSGTLPIWGIDY